MSTRPRATRSSFGMTVAGMAEEALSILGGDGGEGWAKRRVKAFGRPCRRFAQERLQLGLGGLDRVQVWGVGRPVTVSEAGTVQESSHPGCLVGAEIVHHQ